MDTAKRQLTPVSTDSGQKRNIIQIKGTYSWPAVQHEAGHYVILAANKSTVHLFFVAIYWHNTLMLPYTPYIKYPGRLTAAFVTLDFLSSQTRQLKAVLNSPALGAPHPLSLYHEVLCKHSLRALAIACKLLASSL